MRGRQLTHEEALHWFVALLQVPRTLDLRRGWNGSPFRALGSDGMACIDFFLMENMRFVVNEANTIPGFTDISMYLKAMAAPGLHRLAQRHFNGTAAFLRGMTT